MQASKVFERNKMRTKLSDDSGITLVIVLMIMAVLLSIISAGLMFSGINTKITGNYQYGTKAFYAADAGIGQGISQLSANPTTATAAFGPTDMGNGLKYRSGSRSAGTPQPMQLVGKRQGTGFSLNSGTGYNTSGYVFYQYQMNVTGTYDAGLVEMAGREVEAQALFGPVSQ
jgi:Tfp pilus assembly protein PilX